MNGRTDTITIHVLGDMLRTLVLPTGLITVEEDAFRNNTLIQQVILGTDVTQVQAYAFADCPELKEVEFRNGNCTVDESAFANCNGGLVFYCPAGSDLVETLKSYGWTVNP